MSTDFWLISAPAEKTCQQTWDRLNQATSMERLSLNHKFNIPDLKVGTLDVLVGLSDDLGKVDAYAESVCRKVAHSLGNEVLEGARDKLLENLRVNDVPPSQYLQNFNWDLAKYPIKQSLKSISEIIGKQVSQIEAELKNKMSNYVNLKGSLHSLEKKAGGSLLTRYLGDIVKREHFVLDSEYMMTLLVVVPKTLQNDWFSRYEKLTDMVVPRSSKILFEDGEFCLCNVTLFRKAADTFRHQCRENKFVVREFQYSEEDIEAGKTEIQKLNTDLRKQYGPLVKWLKINYGECFSAWIHVKALRIFVESVLRYGLPVNFQAMLLQPNKRSVKRLREVLNQLYGHLDNTAVAGAKDQAPTDIPGLNIGGTDYYPYVYYRLQLNHGDISGAL